ncbi:MAG TPA: CHRD domain-containing protein [Phycisphaerae bacterium]|nr:CHRD domain-containing protein [Phycisphaerae bacterium]
MRAYRTVLFGALLGLATMPATATVYLFHADLDGLQEVPPNASPGFGSVDLTLNDATGDVTVTSGSFNGLLGSTTASHVHGLANPGTNAGVLFPLTITLGATSGTISGGGVLTAPNIAGMIAEQTYINVHTQLFSGGEIRGQVRLVPEPGSLLLLGFGAVIALRRRSAGTS